MATDDLDRLSDPSALLDMAQEAIGDDPGYAGQLARRAHQVGIARHDRRVVARAAYLSAQAAALSGQLRDALELIGEAESAYADIGAVPERIRVGLGRSHVLNELGRHSEALTAARAVVDQARVLDRALIGESAVATLLGAGHQNCGLCLELLGRYADALEHYASAAREYTRAGEAGASGLGQVRANRAGVLVQLARPVAAAREYRLAAAVFAEHGDRMREASSRTRLAEVLLVLGDFTESLQELDRTRRLLETIDAPVEQHNWSMATARWFVALGLVPEAISQYRAAQRWLDTTQQHAEMARVHLELAAAEDRQGRRAEAAAELAAAVTAFDEAGNLPMSAAALVRAARLARAEGRPEAARLASQALALATQSGSRLIAAQARVVLALAEPNGPLRDEAFDLARHEFTESGAVVDRAELDARQGLDLVRRGELVRGGELLRSAHQVLAALGDAVGFDSLRWRSSEPRALVQEGLTELHVASGNAVELAALIDRAGGEGIERLLDQQVAPGYRSEMIEATWIADALMSAAQAGNHRLVEALRRRQHDVGMASSARMASSSLRPVELADAPTWQPRARAASAVVRYFSAEGHFGAVVEVSGTSHVLQRLGSVEAVELWSRRLDSHLSRQRLGSAFTAPHAAALAASTSRCLRQLFELLMAPVLDRLPAQVRALAIVPAGPLWRLPFAALRDDTGYLAERVAVHLAPSGTVLERCIARTAPDGAVRLAVGVDDPSIPDAEDEARAVAAAIDGCRSLTGAAARPAALRGRPIGFLHLAAHAVMRADNPMFSALRLADGWLSAVDLLSLDLSGAVVVLSGCDTARAQSPIGGEPTGFVRAALAAGARSLVGALWPVPDGPTRALTQRWATHLGDRMSPSEALRRAQLEMIDLDLHPYGWAGFTVIGAP